ncbi:EAL domain-containing protein [Oxalobacteraceae bacterium R-40]|uniref:EAL domain-containing protein n=1 Tax=Keguizhuia sedimenti TaxID=3064264 RepID=A0ABU1BNF8_9BURK|nr:EAL domain-containing protein [Oxalobacteraceae bacterium R-40]
MSATVTASARLQAAKSLLKTLPLSLFFWPLVCAALIAGIWLLTSVRITNERAIAEADIFNEASAYSKAYAEQLDRTISQIEQLTLSLQYQWMKNAAAVSLEEQLLYGIFPRTGKIYVSILDKSSRAVTSTLPGPPLEAGKTEYFRFHRTYSDSRLRVDTALIEGKRAGTPILRFTRRLDHEDGTFSGVVVVGIEPNYLASFNDENSLGPRDFISIRHENGTLFVSEKGKDIRGRGQVHVAPPDFRTVYGISRIAGSAFKDKEARIFAWQKQKNYPLYSYAGLAESSHLAMHLQTARNYRSIATISSIALFLFCAFGMFLSLRLARRKIQAEKVRRTFNLAIDAAREGFYMVRPLYGDSGKLIDFVVEDCNERGAELVGISKEGLIGLPVSRMPLKELRDHSFGILSKAMQDGFYEEEISLPPKSNGYVPWLYRRCIRSDDGGIAVIVRNISETKRHERMLLSMANTDSLTDLPNRHWLLDSLPSALKKAQETNSLLAILFIDLDGFKDINDSLGHSAGDKLLKAVALRLKSLLRPNDYVVRLGGDEFTVIVTDVASYAEIAQVALRINQSFVLPFQVSAHHGVINASIGIGVYPHDGASTEELLQKADIAMYAAKEERKGTFRFYDDQLFDRLTSRLKKEDELAKAISDDQFVIYYQPRVHACSGELAGLEALVRWNHPERGIVPPDEFIPLAESTGAIISIGATVIEKVCAQLAQWQASGVAVVPVSVNISARQFNTGGIDRLIASLLEQHRLRPELLEVELTESTMMNESSDIASQVATINAMGIRMHVDDFGTGYSSLARLQEFNLHVLKIDRAFTSRLGQSKSGEVLFKSIVSMGKALSMRITAEGVETAEQLRVLQALGCDEIQGYFISRPLPAAEILPLIQKRFLFETRAYSVNA